MKRWILAAALTLLIGSLTACSNKPAEETPVGDAAVSTAVTTTATTTATAAVSAVTTVNDAGETDALAEEEATVTVTTTTAAANGVTATTATLSKTAASAKGSTVTTRMTEPEIHYSEFE